MYYFVCFLQERKLFFEFLKGLERFEYRHGLDHYRMRPVGEDVGGGSGRRGDGATIVHLGPMLKAAIKFHL